MILRHDYLAAHRGRSTGVYTVGVMIFDEHLATLAFPETRRRVHSCEQPRAYHAFVRRSEDSSSETRSTANLSWHRSIWKLLNNIDPYTFVRLYMHARCMYVACIGKGNATIEARIKRTLGRNRHRGYKCTLLRKRPRSRSVPETWKNIVIPGVFGFLKSRASKTPEKLFFFLILLR